MFSVDEDFDVVFGVFEECFGYYLRDSRENVNTLSVVELGMGTLLQNIDDSFLLSLPGGIAESYHYQFSPNIAGILVQLGEGEHSEVLDTVVGELTYISSGEVRPYLKRVCLFGSNKVSKIAVCKSTNFYRFWLPFTTNREYFECIFK